MVRINPDLGEQYLNHAKTRYSAIFSKTRSASHPGFIGQGPTRVKLKLRLDLPNTDGSLVRIVSEDWTKVAAEAGQKILDRIMGDTRLVLMRSSYQKTDIPEECLTMQDSVEDALVAYFSRGNYVAGFAINNKIRYFKGPQRDRSKRHEFDEYHFTPLDSEKSFRTASGVILRRPECIEYVTTPEIGEYSLTGNRFSQALDRWKFNKAMRQFDIPSRHRQSIRDLL